MKWLYSYACFLGLCMCLLAGTPPNPALSPVLSPVNTEVLLTNAPVKTNLMLAVFQRPTTWTKVRNPFQRLTIQEDMPVLQTNEFWEITGMGSWPDLDGQERDFVLLLNKNNTNQTYLYLTAYPEYLTQTNAPSADQVQDSTVIIQGELYWFIGISNNIALFHQNKNTNQWYTKTMSRPGLNVQEIGRREYIGQSVLTEIRTRMWNSQNTAHNKDTSKNRTVPVQNAPVVPPTNSIPSITTNTQPQLFTSPPMDRKINSPPSTGKAN